MILEIAASFTLVYGLWTVYCLESNVRRARALGVPIVRCPVDHNNLGWMIIQPFVWKVVDALPIQWKSLPISIRITRRGWHFMEKSDLHVQMGPVWAMVTPVIILLHFADPAAISEIMTRRKDFNRPIKEYKLLEVYGPCLSTSGSGDDWARHRKVLAAPFNENTMAFVWGEALRQARAMVKSWTSATAMTTGIPSIQKDTRTLALNVLASTGFRKSYDFHGSADSLVEENVDEGVGGGTGYRNSLQTVLDNAIFLMLVPYQRLTLWVLPARWRRVGEAATSFKKYMVKMLEEETTTLNQGKPGSGGLMTGFVHALYAKDAGHKMGLSVDEIFGNLFIINFAGHDTTANTMAFMMLLLAAHPDVQQWLAEEISTAAEQMPDGREWEYERLFPRLNRCHAVLLETLRLYSPIPALPKLTAPQGVQTLMVGETGQVLHIPPGIGTIPHLMSMHTHPEYWGPDVLEWRPSRWIVDAGEPFRERLIELRKGVYFPWSDGPQNCLGKKFAEVEAVAVLATLFERNRLEIVKKEGESVDAAKMRTMQCVNEVDLELLLRMRDADKIKLRYREA
ncbi:cytochrome P450 [Thozetella sp. PMI_491]|nr:cytochrome P450 [Thozetella sp. PMI_491]